MIFSLLSRFGIPPKPVLEVVLIINIVVLCGCSEGAVTQKLRTGKGTTQGSSVEFFRCASFFSSLIQGDSAHSSP